jgi:hypothetical protein
LLESLVELIDDAAREGQDVRVVFLEDQVAPFREALDAAINALKSRQRPQPEPSP